MFSLLFQASGLGDLAPLSQRFLRCHHCGLPHNLTEEVCPITGKPIRKERIQKAISDDSSELKPIPLVKPKGADPRFIGKIIGDKYRITELIGEGGMGTVYGAEHLEIGRRVAIKVLNRAHLGRKEAVARFHQEARAAGTIGHPNICEIYDVGRLENGAPYLVMERLDGRTLADRIQIEGALSFTDVIGTLKQVLSALIAAHAKGIIHRDIKPENIFLAERVGCVPIAKILDFGISKSADESDLGLTRTGMVMGTPYYMAPEQARGEHIDHRVDIYACGVMLYEILTGRRPFIAPSSNALVIQILSTTPRDPRELRPAIPDAFVSVVFKALAKHRAERYDDAKAFIAALDEVAMQLEHPLMNAPVDRLSQKAHEQSMAQYPSEPPASDSIDIPVHFSETGTGQHPVTLETGDVEVELDTGPRVVDDDPTMVAGRIGFEPRMAEDEVHDTIVDPTGALRGELFSHLGKTPESGGPKSRAVVPDRLVESVDKPQGEIDRDVGGRYSMISSSSEPSGPVWGYDRAAESKNTPRQSATRPSTAKRTRMPSDPDDVDDSAATTLFVNSEDGPKDVQNTGSSSLPRRSS